MMQPNKSKDAWDRSAERTVLQPADHASFFEALDGPPEPTERLRVAAERHGDKVNSV